MSKTWRRVSTEAKSPDEGISGMDMKRPFQVSEDLYPFESRWCEVDGIPIHYIDEGEGPVLLLLHGNFMWSFCYRNVIRELRNEFRCIAIDLPGMGMSGKPHRLGRDDYHYTYEEQSRSLEAAIDLLGLSDMTLLAYDHGGPIGFGVATRRPALFAKLLISNTWAWSCHEHTHTRIWSLCARILPGGVRQLIANKQRWRFESPKDLDQPGVWEACIAPYSTSDDFMPLIALASELTRAKKYFDGVGRRMDVLNQKPTEIIWATAAGSLFPEYTDENQFLRRWQGIFPNAPVTKMDRVGFNFMTRPPSEFLETIRRFATP